MIFTLLPITVPTVQQKWPIGTALMSLNDVIKNLAGKDMPWIGLFRKYLRQAAIMMRFVCLTQIILFILIFGGHEYSSDERAESSSRILIR